MNLNKRNVYFQTFKVFKVTAKIGNSVDISSATLGSRFFVYCIFLSFFSYKVNL